MSSVFRAHDERLGRDVALKLLLPHLAADPVIATRFEREARALAAIRHPNVIGVFDVVDGSTDEPPFLVLELAEGGTLADRLADDGRLSPGEVARITSETARGLAALHAAGLVHRDVKPANVLFAGAVAKVGDLGIVGRLSEDGAVELDPLTDGGVIGTLRYLSPEALAGETAGPSADTFGLAATAFEALTGRPARDAGSITALADVTARPPLVSAVAPQLGTAYDALFGAALAADPSERPTPIAFADALTDVAAGAAAGQGTTIVSAVARPSNLAMTRSAVHTAPLPASPRRASSPRSRRDPVLPLLFIGAAALTVAAVLVALGGIRPGPSAGGTAAVSLPPTIIPTDTPTATPTSSPTPTATPTATPTPVDPAIDAIARMRAAVDGAQGHGGLKGNDIKELQRDIDQIAAALQAGDRDEARRRADELAGRVERLSHDKRLDEDVADRLSSAAESLRSTLGADD
jgi:serine/threonine-protein kinase